MERGGGLAEGGGEVFAGGKEVARVEGDSGEAERAVEVLGLPAGVEDLGEDSVHSGKFEATET